MENDDIEIFITHAKQGNTLAFSSLVKLHQQSIFRYCYSMLGHRQDAEDSVQETFIRAYQSLHRYEHKGHFIGWLLTIAHRICLNKLGMNKRFNNLIHKITSHPIPATSTLLMTYEESKNENIFTLLNILKPKPRAIVILKVIHGFSYDEISQILHESPSNLRKQFERAKKLLQKQDKFLLIDKEREFNYDYSTNLRTNHQ